MGVQTSLVKKRVRNGVTRLIIDFYYSDKTGKRLRFVRHAEPGRPATVRRRPLGTTGAPASTGNPETEKRDVVTLGEFYESTFKPKVLPLYRKNTRIRYEALWRQRIATSFGAELLDAITEGSLRGFARSIELEKRKAKGPVAFDADRSCA